MHSVHCLVLRERGERIHPRRFCFAVTLGFLHVECDAIFFSYEEGNDMWIDLRDYEVVDVEHLCQTGHRQIVIN